MTQPSTRTEQTATVRVLEAAARQSLHAPSVFNTQPWRWRVTTDALELRVDPQRRLATTDPDGRLLTLSCGAALHHARLSLVAAGWGVTVDRFPDPDDPELLARLRTTGPADLDVAAGRLVDAIPRRRTDRRAYGDRPVPASLLSRLRTAVEAEGAYLHVVRIDQMPMLAVSTARAADAELADPAYREELRRWTNRPADSGDGVPTATTVRPAPRRVPVRDHALGGAAGLSAGTNFDRGAAYVILFGERDDPAAWLRGGEALSALLLTATAEGLATAPLSDAIELAWPRRMMRELLAGVGEPYLVIRVGWGPDEELPPAPRRAPADVIEVDA
ncbi:MULTISPECIES: Acg family FMN-binding oxidoreductase [Micromonospora]|uniref:Nitroreductase n=1 Tax=Micromonospora solifontis TaxID=2487138 RepID=A0ABX9WES1_9ACTN|nr:MULTISPECIES: nitroreductase [Micromonospora]NES16492.1 nitroreductase [Micromonospora sp. PPF5-17B]NES37418.1 nitroreductase [Micromonospora solifontis]NES58224.1 nitroreductase [Micromonospora sp. PPF5-6]RNL98330.1 nitroreductase [Micromonospora solifontis]